MHLNRTKGLRYIARSGAILTIAATLVFSDKISVNPSIEDLVVFAANPVIVNSNEESIMSSSSFESESYDDAYEDMTIVSQITTSACVSSDFNDIVIIKDDTVVNKNTETVHQNKPPVNNGSNLDAYHGTCNGPSGKETYYNLPMNGVIRIMRSMGYSEEEYPYWVREDGVKMFGDYIMVAADLNIRPKGTILECSLGTAIVVDTGDFAKTNHTQLDVATSW